LSALFAQAPIVSARGIVNRFGRQVVHDGVELDVYPGEVFGIVGGSGSGKSVLLRTLLGLQRPRAGEVWIDGRPVLRADDHRSVAPPEVKRRYGVTFQHGALFTSLTVRQNVEVPMLEHLGLGAAARERLAELRLRLVGLPPEAGAKYPAQLSGGMVKRAALARALALDPPLLFLDEPTSGLDPIAAAGFDDLLLELQRELGLTVVMITHDLDTLFRTCNRLGVIVDRQLVSGTVDEILAHPHPWIQEYFGGLRGRAALAGSGRRFPSRPAGGDGDGP
jgi:phospholipid/cholesterol/gamma-HCH transport system ATP-binding protein